MQRPVRSKAAPEYEDIRPGDGQVLPDDISAVLADFREDVLHPPGHGHRGAPGLQLLEDLARHDAGEQLVAVGQRHRRRELIGLAGEPGHAHARTAVTADTHPRLMSPGSRSQSSGSRSPLYATPPTVW